MSSELTTLHTESFEELPLLDPGNHEQVERYFQADVKHYVEQFKTKLEQDARFKYPGSIEKAEKYGSAIRTGHNKSKDKADEKEEFSGFYAANKPYGACDDPDEFGPMGVGYATYFFWFKLLIGMVVIPFMLVSGGFMWSHLHGSSCYTPERINQNYKTLEKVVKSNYKPTKADLEGLEQGELEIFTKQPKYISKYLKLICLAKVGMEDCDNFRSQGCYVNGKQSPKCSHLVLNMYLDRYRATVCQKTVISVLGASNVIGNSYHEQSLNIPIVAVILLALAMIIYFHAWHLTKDRVLNHEFLTLDDISVRIVGIPTDIENPYLALKTALIKADPKYEPRKISLLFNTDYLNKAKEKLDKTKRMIVLHKLKHPQITAGSSEDKDFKLLEKKQAKRIDAIAACIQEYNSGKSRFFLGEAYVSFATTKLAKEAYSDFRKQFWRVFKDKHTLRIGNTNLFAQRSDHPLDIVWTNLHVKSWERFWRSIVASAISVFMFLFNLAIFFYVNVWVDKFLGQYKGGFASKLLELAVSLVVFVAEGILENLVRYLAKFQKPTTITKEAASDAHRVWLICFANSGVLPLVVAVNLANFFGTIGLVQNIHNYMLISMLLVPGLKLGKSYVANFIQNQGRNRIKKAMQSGDHSSELFQDKLNTYWRPQDFDMSEAYSGVMNVVSVAFFYIPILPIAGVYLLVALVLIYWTDKYLLVNCSNKLVNYSGYISKKLLGDLELLVALFIAGICLKNYLFCLTHDIPPKILSGSLLLPIFLGLLSYFEVFRRVSDVFLRVKDSSHTPRRGASSGNPQGEEEADADYEEVRKYDPHEYYVVNPAKTFFHLHPDLKLRPAESSVLSPAQSFN